MPIDTEKLRQLRQSIEVVLGSDLEKLRRETEVRRTALWHEVRTSGERFDREWRTDASPEEQATFKADAAMAKLLLAAAARANGEKSPIINNFSDVEMDQAAAFERSNVFDVLAIEDIADRMARRQDVYNLAMGFYRSEHDNLDALLDAPVQRDLKVAFNRRYRERLDKVLKAVQAYIAKWGIDSFVGHVEGAARQAAPPPAPAAREPVAAGHRPTTTVAPPKAPETPSDKLWKRIDRLRIILGIGVTVFTLLGFLGWKLWFNGASDALLILQSVPGDAGTIQFSPLPNGSGRYASGTKVVLEARPAGGHGFVRWSGDANGTEPLFVVTMDQDKRVVAEFK